MKSKERIVKEKRRGNRAQVDFQANYAATSERLPRRRFAWIELQSPLDNSVRVCRRILRFEPGEPLDHSPSSRPIKSKEFHL